jgi:hypothetical protein
MVSFIFDFLFTVLSRMKVSLHFVFLALTIGLGIVVCVGIILSQFIPSSSASSFSLTRDGVSTAQQALGDAVLQHGQQALSFSSTSANSNEMEIRFVNKFSSEVSVYFDDGEAGMYLFSLKIDEESTIQAYVDQVFYATDSNNGERINSIKVMRNVYKYYIQVPVSSVTLNYEHRTRPHPVILPLRQGPSHAAYVKFRSLSGRVVQIWFDNGAGGIYEGQLSPGQVTSTNAYHGHVFYITVKGQKTEIARFTVVPNKVGKISQPKVLCLFSCNSW